MGRILSEQCDGSKRRQKVVLQIQTCKHLASLRIRMLPLFLISMGILGWASVAEGACSGSLLGSMDEVQRHLTAVCGGQNLAAQTPACTLWRTCLNSTTSRDMCDSYAIRASMCLDVAAAEDCELLDTALASPEERTACLSSLAYKMPSTETLQLAVRSMCNMHTMPGCSVCESNGCPDPLGTLSAMCLDHTMAQCSTWRNFCGGYPSLSTSSLCTTTPMPRASSGPSTSNITAPASTLAQQSTYTHPCLEDSKKEECRGYVFPEAEVQLDIGELCEDMPDMSGCSVRSMCQGGRMEGAYCQSFVLLASLCYDMPMMRGCRRYSQLCQPGTVVAQCSNQPHIPKIPGTMDARDAVLSSCGDHAMPSCYKCQSKMNCPDPLDALSSVCREMPTMSQCKGYLEFCAASPQDLLRPYCSSDPTILPSMKMYFHQRVRELVLWREWIPSSNGQYVGALIAVMLLGIVSTATKVYRARLEAFWIDEALEGRSHIDAIVDEDSSHHAKERINRGAYWLEVECDKGHSLSIMEPLLPPRRSTSAPQETVKQNSIRAALTLVTTIIDYASMLIVMTFNVGLFFAVVAGYVIGTLLLSHLAMPSVRLYSNQGAIHADILADMEKGKADSSEDLTQDLRLAVHKGTVRAAMCENCC